MSKLEFTDAIFINDFDSANLFKVEQKSSSSRQEIQVKDGKPQSTPMLTKRSIDAEYELWTSKDCQETAFENPNRSWFYFGIQASGSGKTILMHIMNLNRQGKLYSQGMSIISKTVSSKKGKWERIRDRLEHKIVDGSSVLSFTFHFAEASPSITYFAFCYPFSYIECQQYLDAIDTKYLKHGYQVKSTPSSMIYYHRETLCYTLDNLKVDLITISSMDSITSLREKRLDGLFPDRGIPRSHIFENKKELFDSYMQTEKIYLNKIWQVVFLSSRVHPGETQSSFVMNGLIEFLLRRNDPRSLALRDIYVFKLIPMLNPDGVKRGHYRTDSRGMNLNRVYSHPDPHLHPSIYGAKSVILYYHTLYEDKDNTNNNNIKCNSVQANIPLIIDTKASSSGKIIQTIPIETHSGLAYYIDLHGHASKRGCFMYANHLPDESAQEKCMLLPKIMSINSPNFDFAACNFSEKNMYLKDKRDGLSKEGSGRVAVYKATSIAACYTLECNYNTGRMVNSIPPSTPDNGRATPPLQSAYVAPYTMATFEEIGRSIAISILDLVNKNPWSRIKSSEFHSLQGVQNWIKRHLSKSKTPQAKSKIADSQLKSRACSGILSKVVSTKDNLLANKDKCKPHMLTSLECIDSPKGKKAVIVAIDDKTKMTLRRARCQSSPFPLSCNRPMSHFKHKSVSYVENINQANNLTSKVGNIEASRLNSRIRVKINKDDDDDIKIIQQIIHAKTDNSIETRYILKEQKNIAEKCSSQHKINSPLLPALKSKSAMKNKRKVESSKQTKRKIHNNSIHQINIKGNESQFSIPVLNSKKVIPINKHINDSKSILKINNKGKLDIVLRPDVQIPTHTFPCIDDINKDKDAVAYWVDGE